MGQWRFDLAHRILQYVADDGTVAWYDPANPAGSTIDLSQTPDVAQMIAAYFAGDPDASRAVTEYFGGMNDTDAATRGARDAILPTAAQLNAGTGAFETATSGARLANELNERRDRLRRQIAEAGFSDVSIPGVPAAQGPAAPAAISELAATDPDYVNALSRMQGAAQAAAAYGQEHALVGAEEAYGRRAEGARRLGEYRQAIQSRDALAEALADAEDAASRDPRQARAITMITDAQGRPQAVHQSNLGLARRAEAARRSIDELGMAYFPDVTVAGMRQQAQARAAMPSYRPGDVHYSWLDPELDPMKARGAPVPSSGSGGAAYRIGGRVGAGELVMPRYAAGGGSWLGGGSWPAPGAADPAQPAVGEGQYPQAQIAPQDPEEERQVRQGRARLGLEQEELGRDRAAADQRFRQQMAQAEQQYQIEAAALGQRRTQTRQQFEREQAGIVAERAALQREITLRQTAPPRGAGAVYG